MQLRTLSLAALSLAGALSSARPASAQANASGKAAAESLFDQGVKLMKAAKYDEACPTLEESQRVDPGVGTLLYLGECYEKVGRTASAWATFREAGSLATTSNQAERAKIAGERAARLEPKLAYVKLTVTPDTLNVPGVTVKIGAAEIHPGLQGVSTPVDPGPQRVEVTAPGYDTYTITVNVEAAGRYEVVVPPLHAADHPAPPAAVAPAVAAEPAAPPPAPPSADVEPAPAAHSSPLKTVGIVVGAAGIVGIGFGTYFGVRAINKNHDAEQACPTTVCSTADDYDLSKQAKDAATASTIAFAVGGAALAAGVVLFVTAPKKEVGLTFTPYAGGGTLALRGRL
jgi:serine/threonine-protein kinase